MWAFAPTSGEGARLTGGRFNPIGTSALYLSLTQIGALLESQQGFSKKAQPKTICEYDLDIEKIADLTDAKVCQYFNIEIEKLSCAWMLDKKPYTQQIATRLIKKGVNGIIVPSFATAAESCFNIVIWKWSEKKPQQVIVINDDNALPKNQQSWQ